MSLDDFATRFGPDIATALLTVAPRYKHEKFSAEKEWRLIRRQPALSPPPMLPLRFRQSGSLIVPYLELKLHSPVDDSMSVSPTGELPGNSPVAAITIGPSPYPDELSYSVNHMAVSKGLFLDVSVSQVPFRNW
jgi:hypothetical protein